MTAMTGKGAEGNKDHLANLLVKGVEQVTPVKQDTEYVIYCTTDNLEEVFKVEGVDDTKTVTNNLSGSMPKICVTNS